MMKDLRPDPHTSHHHSRRAHPIFRTHTEPPKGCSGRSSPPLHPAAAPPPPPHPHAAGHGATAGPWQHMANTYAWVVEQEFVKVDRKNRTTEQWIYEQKLPDRVNARERRNIEERVRRRMWEEAMNHYEAEAEKWMRQEENLRRMAAERERQKAKAIQEELRRFEAQMRDKQEAEKQQRRGTPPSSSQDRYRAQQAAREREHRGRVRAEKSVHMSDAWEKYEKRWAGLSASSESVLEFGDISWPVQALVTKPEDITPAGISNFLLSPLHSQNQSRKERIRTAQLRFHPDRFQRVMKRVKEEDKTRVSEAVGIVARCLNDMMAREKSVHRQP